MVNSKAYLDDLMMKRAIELAESGEFATIEAVQRRVRDEGHETPDDLFGAGWWRDDLYEALSRGRPGAAKS